MDQDGYLISIALNKRYMTVGQKAVLANNYSKILSNEAEEERAINAIEKR